MQPNPLIVEFDSWSVDGNSIVETNRLLAIREVLENKGPVIVEHRFYYGASAPARLVFDDYGELVRYLGARTKPGDAIWVWSYADLCRDDNPLARGKCPDAKGRTPARGAY